MGRGRQRKARITSIFAIVYITYIMRHKPLRFKSGCRRQAKLVGGTRIFQLYLSNCYLSMIFNLLVIESRLWQNFKPSIKMNDITPAIEIIGFKKRYGDYMAVKGLDLTISQGTFFGFVGPNGAGKSTTINAMVGLIKPSGGTIKIAGYDVTKEPLNVKARVGFMAEETILYERLTGREYLEFVGMMYGMSRKNAIERRESLLGLLDLDGNKFMGSFSLGMKKKIALASALIHNPPIVILDEPFSGIDATTGSRIRKVLGEMVSQGHTVFFSSHVLETVEKISSKIGVIDKGRLLAIGSLPEIREKAGCDPNASLEEVFLKLVESKPGE